MDNTITQRKEQLVRSTGIYSVLRKAITQSEAIMSALIMHD